MKTAFSDDKNWIDALAKDQNVLVQALKNDIFKSEDEEGAFNIDILILWAMMLCGGDAKTKTRVFYDVLQDNNQEFISASDKDFPGSFSAIIDLANKVAYTSEEIVTK